MGAHGESCSSYCSRLVSPQVLRLSGEEDMPMLAGDSVADSTAEEAADVAKIRIS